MPKMTRERWAMLVPVLIATAGVMTIVHDEGNGGWEILGVVLTVLGCLSAGMIKAVTSPEFRAGVAYAAKLNKEAATRAELGLKDAANAPDAKIYHWPSSSVRDGHL